MSNVFADHLVQHREVDDLHAESLEVSGCRVNSEVVGRLESAGCDQSIMPTKDSVSIAP